MVAGIAVTHNWIAIRIQLRIAKHKINIRRKGAADVQNSALLT